MPTKPTGRGYPAMAPGWPTSRWIPWTEANKLFVANGDGSGARQVMLSGLYVPPIIDAPIFTPDDQNILYSAITPTQSYRAELAGPVFRG